MTTLASPLTILSSSAIRKIITTIKRIKPFRTIRLGSLNNQRLSGWGSSSPSQTTTIAEAMEPAKAVLVKTRSSPKPKTYAERSKLTEVPISTLWYHEHGRLSRKDAAAKRQYLTPSEEKALVDCILGAAESDHPVLVKSVGQLARTIARRRSSTFEFFADDDSIRPQERTGSKTSINATQS